MLAAYIAKCFLIIEKKNLAAFLLMARIIG
jgi:hypothetical protein